MEDDDKNDDMLRNTVRSDNLTEKPTSPTKKKLSLQ